MLFKTRFPERESMLINYLQKKKSHLSVSKKYLDFCLDLKYS